MMVETKDRFGNVSRHPRLGILRPAEVVQQVGVPDALRLGEFVLTGADGAVLARIRVAREPEGQWALDNADGVLRVFPAGTGIATEAAAYGAR